MIDRMASGSQVINVELEIDPVTGREPSRGGTRAVLPKLPRRNQEYASQRIHRRCRSDCITQGGKSLFLQIAQGLIREVFCSRRLRKALSATHLNVQVKSIYNTQPLQ